MFLYIHNCAYTYVYIHICSYIYIYICLSLSLSLYIYIYVYIYIYICVYIYIYIYIYSAPSALRMPHLAGVFSGVRSHLPPSATCLTPGMRYPAHLTVPVPPAELKIHQRASAVETGCSDLYDVIY